MLVQNDHAMVGLPVYHVINNITFYISRTHATLSSVIFTGDGKQLNVPAH